MNGVRLQVTTCIVTHSYMYMTSAVDRYFMPDLCTYDHIMKFVMKSMKAAYGEVIMRVKIWRGWTCLSSGNCKNTRNQMCADCRSTTQFPRLSAFYSNLVAKYCLYSWDNLGKTSLIAELLLIILIVVLINLLVFFFVFFLLFVFQPLQLRLLYNELKPLLAVDFVASLPKELAERIFSYLSVKSLSCVAQCNRLWRERSNHNAFWYVYMQST